MIGVEGQWVISLSLNGTTMNIQSTDLIAFNTIEEAGNLLPMWKLDFLASDYSFSKNWNEGAVLTCSIGRNRDDLRELSLVVTKPSSYPNGSNQIRYTAYGLYNALGYVNTPHVRTLGACDSLTVLKAVVGNYFTWDDDNNVTKSQDKQVFIQPNISDKKFVDHLARHVYLKDSYFGVAITSDGRFRAFDAKQKLSEEPAYSIGTKIYGGPGKALIQMSAPEYASYSSIINPLIGYGTEKPMVDATTGARIVHKPKPNIVAAQATQTPRSVTVERRTQSPVRLTTNHDVNYHVAESNNYMGLMNLSNESVTVLVECGYEPISVWDIVQFTAMATGSTEVDEVRSGKYVVGLVSRQATGLGQNRFLTKIRMFRESTNSIQGDLHG